MRRKLFLVLLLTTIFWVSKGQASWESFGQNRVQYRTFEWKYFDSIHFRALYYDYGKANALYAVSIAEQELAHIVYMMGGRLNKKLNIILYNTFGDYRQTNLGRKNDELNAANGGKLDVAGDYIAVYFNGDHEALRKQIRSGIAKVIKDNMLFGDNLKDVVKNAVQMNLPEWYTLGYVSFIANEWSGENDALIKNSLSLKGKKHILDLALSDPAIYGQSFWHFISATYGENYISNILYLTRYRKSVSSAIESVFKKPSNELYEEWELFYQPPIQAQGSDIDSIAGRSLYMSIKNKTNAQYSHIVASPSGREIAFVEKKDGQFKIYIQDVKYNKAYLIIEGGMRAMEELADPDYPILCWSPSGNKMAALYQQRNVLNLRIFTTGKRIMEKRSIPRRKVDRITGMCFMRDENSLAITAIKKGQSDLYTLTIKNNKFEAITNDIFDEKNPRFVENGTSTGILFLSNRTSRYINQSDKIDEYKQHFNLYLYDPKRGTNLVPLSNTSGSINYPMQWGLEQYSYLEDLNGTLNRKIVSIEKNGTSPDTFSTTNARPVPFSILGQDYLQKNGSVIEVTKEKRNSLIYSAPFAVLKDQQEKYENELKNQLDTSLIISTSNSESVVSEYITPFNSATDSTVLLDNIFSSTRKNTSRYNTFNTASISSKPNVYKSTFYPDFIQTTIDNTLLFTRYQPIDNQYNNPPLYLFSTFTLTDVMEDYKITAGARHELNISSPLEYFLKYANFRRRADWGIVYYHSSQQAIVNAPPSSILPYQGVLSKKGMDFIQSNVTYPLDMLKSIRLQFGIRYDRTRYLAQDQYTIEIPSLKQYTIVSHVEYVYDNTINPMLNIWKGTRAKFFADYMYTFNNKLTGYLNIGYDARNYIPLYKNIILASRIAGAHSLAKTKVLYYLGGVDNAIYSGPDAAGITSSAIGTSAFQSLATNLRGYKQGARKGSSFMVLNEEIRMPVYNTFFNRPIKSGFIRNLQLIAFADAGITMKGILPTSENIVNPIRIRDDQSNVSVYIDRSAALGYGFGLRSRFLGYFLRTDFAWNLGGGKKPMYHISLATDF